MQYDILTTNELRDMLALMEKRASGVGAGPSTQKAAETLAEGLRAELAERNPKQGG